MFNWREVSGRNAELRYERERKARMLLDTKTGKPLSEGMEILRKDYRGFKKRYRVHEILPNMVVLMLIGETALSNVYLSVPMAELSQYSLGVTMF